MPSPTDKSNPTGTTFELKFVCFWITWVQKFKEIAIRDVVFIGIYVFLYSDLNIHLIYKIISYFLWSL